MWNGIIKSWATRYANCLLQLTWQINLTANRNFCQGLQTTQWKLWQDSHIIMYYVYIRYTDIPQCIKQTANISMQIFYPWPVFQCWITSCSLTCRDIHVMLDFLNWMTNLCKLYTRRVCPKKEWAIFHLATWRNFSIVLVNSINALVDYIKLRQAIILCIMIL